MLGMGIQHAINAPYGAANAGCYQCTNPNDVVVFDRIIEGEGILVLCSRCVEDARKVSIAGKARMAKMLKAAGSSLQNGSE